MYIKKEYLELNPGSCLICSGEIPPSGNHKLPLHVNAFYGAPADRMICFSLCERHGAECLGHAHPSGLPQGETLAAAIMNAIEAYDFGAEEKAREEGLREIDAALDLAERSIQFGAFGHAITSADAQVANIETAGGDKKRMERALTVLAAAAERGKDATNLRSALRRLLDLQTSMYGNDSKQSATTLLRMAGACTLEYEVMQTRGLMMTSLLNEAKTYLDRSIPIFGKAGVPADLREVAGKVLILCGHAEQAAQL